MPRFLPLVLLLALGTSGCSQDTSIQNWKQISLQLTKNQTVSNPPAIPDKLKFPRKRDRQIDLPEINISLWQLLKARDCPLSQTIAKKNNQLGKVQPPSLEYISNLKLIYQLEECLNILKEKEHIADKLLLAKLSQVLQIKKENKDHYFWKGFLLDSSFDQFVRTGTGFQLKNTEFENVYSTSMEAIDYLANHFKISNSQSKLVNAEASYIRTIQTLENSRLMGRWVSELFWANHYLKLLGSSTTPTYRNCVLMGKDIEKLTSPIIYFYNRSFLKLLNLGTDTQPQFFKAYLNMLEKEYLTFQERLSSLQQKQSNCT